MANRIDYIELGLACADACRAIPNGTQEESPSMIEAIERLPRWGWIHLAMAIRSPSTKSQDSE